jgi:hypothetical protein
VSDADEDEASVPEAIPPCPPLSYDWRQPSTDPRQRDLDPFPWAEAGPQVRAILERVGVDRNTKPESLSPLQVFQSLVTKDMINGVADASNLKRDVTLATKTPPWAKAAAWPPKLLRSPKWKPVKPNDVWLVIGLTIAHALVRLPTRPDYHSTSNPICRADHLRGVMGRDRYQQVMSALALAKPGDVETKLDKVASLLAQFKSNCQAVYKIGRWAALDEMIAPTRSTWAGGLKVKMDNKPTPEG